MKSSGTKKDYVVGLKRIQSDLHVNQKSASEIAITFTIHARTGKPLTEAQSEFVNDIEALLKRIWNEYDEPIEKTTSNVSVDIQTSSDIVMHNVARQLKQSLSELHNGERVIPKDELPTRLEGSE